MLKLSGGGFYENIGEPGERDGGRKNDEFEVPPVMV
jgi:hypothetical protein